MEDYNDEQNIRNEEKHLCKHSFLKGILTGILVFLGAYCAFYTVADWHFKRMLSPEYQFKQMDKDFIRQERNINKFRELSDKEINNRLTKRIEKAEFIHAEKLNDAYRFTIDLKPFNNDPKNIQVRTEGNMLVIDAENTKNNKNSKEIVKYNQAFAFGEDIKANEITKVHEGNNYIITVPVD